MRINIPIRPVSTSSYHRYTRRGGYISKRGKQFRNEVREIIKEIQPTSKTITVRLDFIFSSKRELDVDNYIKATLDACNGYLWKDDRQIKRITAEKWTGQEIDAITIEWEIIDEKRK